MRTRDAECAEDQTNQSIRRKHDEHAEDAVEDFPLPFLTLRICCL